MINLPDSAINPHRVPQTEFAGLQVSHNKMGKFGGLGSPHRGSPACRRYPVWTWHGGRRSRHAQTARCWNSTWSDRVRHFVSAPGYAIPRCGGVAGGTRYLDESDAGRILVGRICSATPPPRTEGTAAGERNAGGRSSLQCDLTATARRIISPCRRRGSPAV